MTWLKEYDVVRVVLLKAQNRPFDGSEGVRRAPRIGDIGTICHMYDPSNPRAPVIVEMVDRDGHTIWLADFDPDELAVVAVS